MTAEEVEVLIKFHIPKALFSFYFIKSQISFMDILSIHIYFCCN